MKTCKKCGENIPRKFVVNGVIKVSHNRKYCLKCSPFGSHNTSKLELPQRKNIHKNGIETFKCSGCQQELDITNFFIRKTGYPFCYCKKCWGKYISHRLMERKKKLIELMGGKCEKCGYNKCAAALDFHHKDPSQKEFDIGTKNVCFSKIVLEAKKCSLLCSNCHREEHNKN